MPYNDDRGFGGGGFNRPPRQMYDVSSMNIKCADCGVDIKELPFNPDPSKPTDRIRCVECQRKFRMSHPRRGFGGGFGGGRRFDNDRA